MEGVSFSKCKFSRRRGARRETMRLQEEAIRLVWVSFWIWLTYKELASNGAKDKGTRIVFHFHQHADGQQHSWHH